MNTQLVICMCILLEAIVLCSGQRNDGPNTCLKSQKIIDFLSSNYGNVAILYQNVIKNETIVEIQEEVSAMFTIINNMKKDNQTAINQKSISEVQEQVLAMSSTINNMKKDIKTILQHTSAIVKSNNKNDKHKATSLPHSCEEIKSSSPNSKSGHYTIIDSNGHTRHVYCNMGKVCGSKDGWTRVGYLDMSNSEEKCPEGFETYQRGRLRACGRQSGGCISTILPSDGISYSEVCGKVIGYQYGSTDGAHKDSGIDEAYLDGVSITHGSPRSHIWSFISGLQEEESESKCPCGSEDPRPAPSFVGNHYYCESGALPPWQYMMYKDDPLWDGKKCGPIEKSCCDRDGRPYFPWFYRHFKYTTSDYIELRVCSDQDNRNEDIPIHSFEIYVK